MMSRQLKKFLLLMMAFLQLGTVVPQAAFDDTGAGARVPGMAGVNTATASDVDAMYYNPAGLPYMREAQLSSQYGDILKGADDGSSNTNTYLGYAQPLKNKKAAMGFSYNMFNASNLFSERILAFSYGRILHESIFGWSGLWSFGFNLKQLHRQFQPDRFTENALNDAGTGTGESDPLFAKNGYAKDGYAVDGGLMVRFGPHNRHSAGLAIINMNQPDMSLGGDGDKAPLMTKLGAATYPRWGMMSAEIRRARRLATQTDMDIALGAERRFILTQLDSSFLLRGGYAQGSRNYKEMTAGMGYEFGRARLDYAFSFPIGNTTAVGGTHRFGLGFKFTTPKESDKEAEKDQKKSRPTLGNTLPEAPATLVAPAPFEPVVGNNSQIEFDNRVKNFGVILGHYFTRKAEGAKAEEQQTLLNLIKTLYGDKGIDMTLVNKELATIAAAEATPTPSLAPTPEPTPVMRTAPPVTPVATPKPEAKPALVKPVEAPKKAEPIEPKRTPTPAPQKVRNITPKHFDSMSSLSQLAATSTELDQALKYYKMAVERGISDSERIEVLEAILLRFGESAAGKINSELERLRRRNKR